MKSVYRLIPLAIIIFSVLMPLKSAAETHAPIIFVHGLMVPHTVYTERIKLDQFFADQGHTLFIAERPSKLAQAERAAVLAEEIKRLVPTGKYHIIGHSAGGTDSRRMLVEYPELAKRCLSLTTMGTPHRGSVIADEILSNVDEKPYSLSGLFFNYIFGKIENGRQIALEMTTEYMAAFNESFKDVQGVQYFSLGFYIEQPFFQFTKPYIWKNHIKHLQMGIKLNDGTVSLESQMWGTSLGAIPGDHLSETAPIDYGGGLIYQNNFIKILENIETNF